MLRKEKIQGKVEKTIDDTDDNQEIVNEEKQDTAKFLDCEKKN